MIYYEGSKLFIIVVKVIDVFFHSNLMSLT